MLINPFDFNQLIAPITEKEFFSTYWEKKPLLLAKRKAQGYANILSLKDIDFLLSSLSSPSPEWVKFINNKKELKIEDYIKITEHEIGRSSMLNKYSVMSAFRNGTTIVLNQLHERWDSVRELCYQLEQIFGHWVKANVYLTPPNAQGFGAHFDAHDVFILQIEGSKLWKIYDSYVPFPISRKDTPFFGPLNPPIHEIYLKPGDFLYLPRGYVHEASTAQGHSLHITLGIHVVTWVDLFKEMTLSKDFFRRALPRQILLGSNKKQIDKKYQREMEKLCDAATMQKALLKLRKNFKEKKTDTFDQHLTLFDWADKITEKTLLKKRERFTYQYNIQKEQLILLFGVSVLTLSCELEPVIKYILDNPVFSIKTIPSAIPKPQKLTIIRSLIKEGMLVPA